MSTGRAIPDWLAPHKNKWLSSAKLSRLFDKAGDRPFGPWFQEIKGRIKSRKGVALNGQLSTMYLVKNVWAASLAHGLPLRHRYLTEGFDFEREYALLRAQNAELAKKVSDSYTWGGQYEKTIAALRERIKELENDRALVSRKKVAELLVTATAPIPAPGVYFLMLDAVVVYVGQSRNVISRLSGHVEKRFDKVRMIVVEDNSLRSLLERSFIDIFNPPLNIKGRESIIAAERRVGS